MKLHRALLGSCLLLALALPAWAGVHCSLEPVADLPSQWRGFLLDQRLVRNVALKPGPGVPENPVRKRYEEERDRLLKLGKDRKLTADEAADLGAIHLRLGDLDRALEVLRAAHRDNPQHYKAASNLATALQLSGDLEQAAALFPQVIRLAPGKFQKAEELQLKLVRARLREAKGTQTLDDLFGITYAGPEGKYAPGQLAPEQRKKLPEDAVANLQLLALWLPADARLLWQFGELANAHGDVAVAAGVMDGCVTEFGLRNETLLAHRQEVRKATDALKANPDKATHTQEHALTFKPHSTRPLAARLDAGALPAIDPKGVNPLPWAVLSQTAVDTQYRATFPQYLKDLSGKTVELHGYMQPLGEDAESSAFLLIEFPVGCWFCEMPGMTGMVLIELPKDKSLTYTKAPMTITGKLVLNGTDPENFLFTVQEAKVKTQP